MSDTRGVSAPPSNEGRWADEVARRNTPTSEQPADKWIDRECPSCRRKITVRVTYVWTMGGGGDMRWVPVQARPELHARVCHETVLERNAELDARGPTDLWDP